MQTKRKTPMRQCLGCREMLPKRELIRVVRAPEGGGKSKAVERAFGCPVPPEVYDALEKQLEEAGNDG